MHLEVTEYNYNSSHKNHLPACVNLILKRTLISLKFIILLIIMLIDSSYFLELLRKYPGFFFSFLDDCFFKLFSFGGG